MSSRINQNSHATAGACARRASFETAIPRTLLPSILEFAGLASLPALSRLCRHTSRPVAEPSIQSLVADEVERRFPIVFAKLATAAVLDWRKPLQSYARYFKPSTIRIPCADTVMSVAAGNGSVYLGLAGGNVLPLASKALTGPTPSPHVLAAGLGIFCFSAQLFHARPDDPTFPRGRLFFGLTNGDVGVWDCAAKMLNSFSEEDCARTSITCLAYCDLSNTLVSGHANGRLIAWSLPNTATPSIETPLVPRPLLQHRSRMAIRCIQIDQIAGAVLSLSMDCWLHSTTLSGKEKFSYNTARDISSVPNCMELFEGHLAIGSSTGQLMLYAINEKAPTPQGPAVHMHQGFGIKSIAYCGPGLLAMANRLQVVFLDAQRLISGPPVAEIVGQVPLCDLKDVAGKVLVAELRDKDKVHLVVSDRGLLLVSPSHITRMSIQPRPPVGSLRAHAPAAAAVRRGAAAVRRAASAGEAVTPARAAAAGGAATSARAASAGGGGAAAVSGVGVSEKVAV